MRLLFHSPLALFSLGMRGMGLPWDHIYRLCKVCGDDSHHAHNPSQTQFARVTQNVEYVTFICTKTGLVWVATDIR